ncbi:unnamed protein product [Heligmosomoides polygyrus]|uniref:Uncharacterized protein n=1 Tax=Heligmosomoides polygyrus TaxID=6339 RepID=A0A183FLJ8_HELPZ|nr:unnamed protein product [Heligmosomoides polygyrus]
MAFPVRIQKGGDSTISGKAISHSEGKELEFSDARSLHLELNILRVYHDIVMMVTGRQPDEEQQEWRNHVCLTWKVGRQWRAGEGTVDGEGTKRQTNTVIHGWMAI